MAETINNAPLNCRLKASDVLQAVIHGCDCERALFFLVDEVRDEQVAFSIEADIEGFRIPLSAGVSGAVIADCTTVRIADAYADTRFNKEGDKKWGFTTRDIIAVPIVRLGSVPPQVMGVIQARNSNRAGFDAEHEVLLQSIALQARSHASLHLAAYVQPSGVPDPRACGQRHGLACALPGGGPADARADTGHDRDLSERSWYGGGGCREIQELTDGRVCAVQGGAAHAQCRQEGQ